MPTHCVPLVQGEGLARFLSRTGCAPRPGTAHFVRLIVVACRRRCVHARFSAAQAQLVRCLWHMPPAPCVDPKLNSYSCGSAKGHGCVVCRVVLVGVSNNCEAICCSGRVKSGVTVTA